MAHVTYDRYQALGYSAVPQDQFSRWAAKAESEARHAILNRPLIRCKDMPTHYNQHSPKYWSGQNQRGICEIMDARYNEWLSFGDSQPVTSFSNQHYSESYASPAEVSKAVQARVQEIVLTYFTPEQRYRGVG